MSNFANAFTGYTAPRKTNSLAALAKRCSSRMQNKALAQGPQTPRP